MHSATISECLQRKLNLAAEQQNRDAAAMKALTDQLVAATKAKSKCEASLRDAEAKRREMEQDLRISVQPDAPRGDVIKAEVELRRKESDREAILAGEVVPRSVETATSDEERARREFQKKVGEWKASVDTAAAYAMQSVELLKNFGVLDNTSAAEVARVAGFAQQAASGAAILAGGGLAAPLGVMMLANTAFSAFGSRKVNGSQLKAVMRQLAAIHSAVREVDRKVTMQRLEFAEQAEQQADAVDEVKDELVEVKSQLRSLERGQYRLLRNQQAILAEIYNLRQHIAKEFDALNLRLRTIADVQGVILDFLDEESVKGLKQMKLFLRSLAEESNRLMTGEEADRPEVLLDRLALWFNTGDEPRKLFAGGYNVGLREFTRNDDQPPLYLKTRARYEGDQDLLEPPSFVALSRYLGQHDASATNLLETALVPSETIDHLLLKVSLSDDERQEVVSFVASNDRNDAGSSYGRPNARWIEQSLVPETTREVVERVIGFFQVRGWIENPELLGDMRFRSFDEQSTLPPKEVERIQREVSPYLNRALYYLNVTICQQALLSGDSLLPLLYQDMEAVAHSRGRVQLRIERAELKVRLNAILDEQELLRSSGHLDELEMQRKATKVAAANKVAIEASIAKLEAALNADREKQIAAAEPDRSQQEEIREAYLDENYDKLREKYPDSARTIAVPLRQLRSQHTRTVSGLELSAKRAQQFAGQLDDLAAAEEKAIARLNEIGEALATIDDAVDEEFSLDVWSSLFADNPLLSQNFILFFVVQRLRENAVPQAAYSRAVFGRDASALVTALGTGVERSDADLRSRLRFVTTPEVGKPNWWHFDLGATVEESTLILYPLPEPFEIQDGRFRTDEQVSGMSELRDAILSVS